jgi:hypothetical protein
MAKKAKKATNKKTNEPEMGKCYINSKMAGKLDGSGQGMGESFWVEVLTKNTAKVCNNCMCGLCIGDIIEFKAYKNDGIHHPREFVKVKERVAEAVAVRFTFPGMDDIEHGGKFPEDAQKQLNELRNAGLKFECMVRGIGIFAKPTKMSDSKFESLLSGGPIQFSIEN